MPIRINTPLKYGNLEGKTYIFKENDVIRDGIIADSHIVSLLANGAVTRVEERKIEIVEIKEVSPIPRTYSHLQDISGMNVRDAQEYIESLRDYKELIYLAEMEKNGKDRTSVIRTLEARIKILTTFGEENQ